MGGLNSPPFQSRLFSEFAAFSKIAAMCMLFVFNERR